MKRNYHYAFLALASSCFTMAAVGLFLNLSPALVAGAAIVGLFAGIWFTFEQYLRGTQVDIWQQQRELMRISGQSMPDTPHITPASLLYLALIAEELSEGAATVGRALLKRSAEDPAAAPIVRELLKLTNYAGVASRGLRQSLVGYEGHHALNPKEAEDLLDDSSDMAVVVAGLAVSSGIPGPEGYLAVSDSNLSKANPKTGLIDVDSTGKWIKGPKYAPPALGSVIRWHMAAAEE
jgi:hypothetical protein